MTEREIVQQAKQRIAGARRYRETHEEWRIRTECRTTGIHVAQIGTQGTCLHCGTQPFGRVVHHIPKEG